MFSSDSFLKSFKIPSYVNLACKELGHDSYQHCFDKIHYKKFDSVDYNFNEIGFRTKSINQFCGNEILAIGDSYTLGLGVNADQRWTDQLEYMINYPVLNFSLNGGSNDWIARKANQLLNFFQPRYLIIHWTFMHRRERKNQDWTDDERTECEPLYTNQENFENWLNNYHSITFPNTIHSCIPNWNDVKIDYRQYQMLEPIALQDLARDGFHYGPNTHRELAKKFTTLLAV